MTISYSLCPPRLHGYICEPGTKLRVYFGLHTEEQWLDPDPQKRMTFLKPPEVSRNFLLSPPGTFYIFVLTVFLGSPPVGWVQAQESEPSKGSIFVFHL